MDDLLNTGRVDGFDRLQQESVWFYFWHGVRFVVYFCLCQVLMAVFSMCLPTYRIEEENSNGVRGTDDDFPLLNLHSSIEGN